MTATTEDTFTVAFRVLVGEEGGYSDDSHDKGNWTGNVVGVGELRGTKYGISAGSFPSLPIKSLTLDQAKLIYHGKYWSVIHGDSLPPPLALIMFDAAVNNGVFRATQWLQHCLGIVEDGKFGPVTLGTVVSTSISLYALCSCVMNQRMWFMSELPNWRANPGWCTRLARLPWIAQQAFPPKKASP